jgi:hypothetical protein
VRGDTSVSGLSQAVGDICDDLDLSPTEYTIMLGETPKVVAQRLEEAGS